MKKSNCLIITAILLIIVGCSNNGDENVIEESGTIEATTILLSAQTAGEVKNIFFDEGDLINSGDTLLIIDHEILLIRKRQALSQRDGAKAKLDLAITGAREEDIGLTQEQQFQAKSNFELAEKDFERMKKLYHEQVITKKQYDDAETRYKISRSQLKAANENLKKIKNISRPEEITQLRANYENSLANLEMIDKQINDSHIIAPIEGFIVESFLELGETVNMGSSVYKISNLSTVELTVYVNETDLGKVKLGQSAEVSIDTYADRTYEGKVIYISPEAEFTPKNIQTKDERTKLVFKVKIELPNPDFEMKSGMPADAKINI
jgi:HlyD family secretion protein